MNSSPTLNSTISSISNRLHPSESVIAGLDGGTTVVTFDRFVSAPFRGDTSFEMFVFSDNGFCLHRIGEFSMPMGDFREVVVAEVVVAEVVVVVDGPDEDAVCIIDGV